MSIRKRNEFLDDDDSDADGQAGYDSEGAQESRGAVTERASKRRKAQVDLDEDVSGASQERNVRTPLTEPVHAGTTAVTTGNPLDEHKPRIGVARAPVAALRPDRTESPPGDEDDDEDDEEDAGLLNEQPSELSTMPTRKTSTPKSSTAADKAARKSGVVYISRVPPFMKPQTLRRFLTPHAPKGIGRIFLTPEDHAAHARRVKSGGNKKKSFTDGWVEFASKRDAKVAAELLNGNIIGGKKGNFYHDDLWNIKYLRRFKWSHLTEQIANENAARAARMREEVRRTKVENKRFVQDVERGKMLEGIEGKRRAKGFADAQEDAGGGEKKAKRRKEFKQRNVQRAQDNGDAKAKEIAERTARKIF